ncbi:transmembrane protein 231-like isoform X2 [Limulus polyphemus]|uniref:Transmembrane protein 231 n=1 Tax=Limulus polyphemus TaxID=6850 RepID=A0ABM1BAC3_LIMPO|nr:transmembrane protein 231-like isoform X2 [Limulus polyphemus]
MVVYKVFSNCIVQTYKTSICSKVTLIYMVFLILTFVPPFLIAYRSQGFWKKTEVYQEQPDVHFKHQLIIILENKSHGETLVWSTFSQLNNVVQNNLRIPVIKTKEEDVNKDGRFDSLDLKVEMPLHDEEEVYSVKMLLFFDYELYTYSNLRMEGLGYFFYNSPLAGSQLFMIGELRLHQREPLSNKGRDERFNIPIIDTNDRNTEKYTIEKILNSYVRRNVTTYLGNEYVDWKTGRGAKKPFIISLNILYPEETIIYKTGFWQLLKWAWIQYAAMLLIFLYIIHQIKDFVFRNQLFSTIVDNPLKKH